MSLCVFELRMYMTFNVPLSSCVSIQEHEAFGIETYHCPNCVDQHGPLVCEYCTSYSQCHQPVTVAFPSRTTMLDSEAKTEYTSS